MNIGEVLSRAWEIIWKNKILWIFGLFASLAGSSGGNNFNYRLAQNTGTRNFPIDIPAWAIGLLILLFLVLLVVFIILAALGRSGLVRGAWLADSGEANLTFSRLFRESRAYFIRVLLLGILVVMMSLVLVLILIVPTVLTCGIIWICMVPLFIALSVIVELAIVAIVGEDQGIMESLRRAWEIARANLALVITIGLVLVIISTVIGFLAILPVIAIAAPAAILFTTNAGQISNATLIVSVLLFLLYLPVFLTVNAIVTSYVTTTWTVTFRRLSGRLAGSGTPLPAEPISTL